MNNDIGLNKNIIIERNNIEFYNSENIIDEYKIPKHIGIIMGGNATWAKSKNFTTQEGHNQGAKNIENIVESCLKLNIKNLTIYAFSTENWQRPKDEVENLLNILNFFLKDKLSYFKDKNVRVKHIGSLSGLDNETISRIKNIEDLTKNNKDLFLDIAFGYGGRQEIVDATKKICQLLINKKINIEDIDQELFSKQLYDPEIIDPDLIIRTGGGYRTSNFLTWQSIYSEYYFTDTTWPEFNEDKLVEAIKDYSSRKRTFGKRDLDLMLSELK